MAERLDWVEGPDGFRAECRGADMFVKFRSRGRWNWTIVHENWKAAGSAKTLTEAQQFAELIACAAPGGDDDG